MRVRKGCTWGIAFLVGLALQTRVQAADDSSNEPPSQPRRTDQGHLLAGWFNASKKPKEIQAARQKSTQEQTGPAEQAAKLRAREQDALLRRLDVCDQLRVIAARKGDEVLMRRADNLAERVWQLYTRRVEKLRATASSKRTHELQIDTVATATSASRKGVVQDRNADASVKETKP